MDLSCDYTGVRAGSRVDEPKVKSSVQEGRGQPPASRLAAPIRSLIKRPTATHHRRRRLLRPPSAERNRTSAVSVPLDRSCDSIASVLAVPSASRSIFVASGNVHHSAARILRWNIVPGSAAVDNLSLRSRRYRGGFS